jgi:hypothetical protein
VKAFLALKLIMIPLADYVKIIVAEETLNEHKLKTKSTVNSLRPASNH